MTTHPEQPVHDLAIRLDEENRRLREALAAARRSLENVRALAARASISKKPLLRDEIGHLLRFCEEAGVTGSVLREGAAPAAGEEWKHG